jgi:hypothetical protein
VSSLRLAIYAAIVAAITAGIALFASHERDIGRHEVQAKWDSAIQRQQAEAIAQAQTNAKETLRRMEQQQEAQHDHDAELATYRQTITAANADLDRLHVRVAELTAAARRSASDTATASERAAGTAAAGMLAELSGGAAALAELYARQADSNRRAGLLCERDYDSLKGTP